MPQHHKPASVIRSDDLRAENRHRILYELRAHGSLARTRLSLNTGLSPASLSKLIGELSSEGILSSSNLSNSTDAGQAVKEKVQRGRPETIISLTPAAAMAVTVSLFFNRLSVRLLDYCGNELFEKTTRIDITQLDNTKLCQLMINEIQHCLSAAPSMRLRSIAIGLEGITSNQDGKLLWSPILRLRQAPITEPISQHFEVPTTLNNDCHLITDALFHTQKERLGESFITVLFSHGIGMGIYINGRPFTGARSSALEFGHITHIQNGEACRCGKLGCIEAYAADYSMLRLANNKALNNLVPPDIPNTEIAKVMKLAKLGKSRHKAVFTTAAQAIGQGLATVFTLVDVMPVALVGRSAEAIDFMLPDLLQSIEVAKRYEDNFDSLIHCFEHHEPLLWKGLAINSMKTIDQQLAK